MRRLIKTILCMGGLVLLPVPQAMAQSTRWTSPNDEFALTVPDGWERATDITVDGNKNVELLLTAGRRSKTATPQDSVLCDVARTPLNSDADYIVAKLNRLTREEATTSGAVKYTIISRDVAINGAPVLDFERKLSGPRADGSTDRTRSVRTFPIVSGPRTFEIAISCSKPREQSQVTLNEVHAFIDSLEINRP